MTRAVEERAALGARCRELLKSEDFKAAIMALEREYGEAILRTAMEEADKRERLFAEYHGLRRIVHRLRNWEQDGVLAMREIESASEE